MPKHNDVVNEAMTIASGGSLPLAVECKLVYSGAAGVGAREQLFTICLAHAVLQRSTISVQYPMQGNGGVSESTSNRA